MVIKEDSMVTETIASATTMEQNNTTDKASIIAQEIKFARALAGNDPTLRKRVLKNLKTWLTTRSQSTFAFSDADFLRLWKGLFYCMWMSDKPLVQEELAESLGLLVRCFDHDVPVAMQFFKAFLMTIGNEWFGIDRWRMDKFMMLVRRVTRQALFTVHVNGWKLEDVERLTQTINATILNSDVTSFGLLNHFNDLILNEVAKVSDGQIPTEAVTKFVEVFVECMLKTDDTTVSGSIKKHILNALMQQSELGQMFQEKFDLWKNRNFVTGNIDNVEFKVEDEDEEEEGDENGEGGGEEGREDDEEQQDEEEMEEEETPEDDGPREYDPRAGRVNVEIPQIEFDPHQIIALFEKYRYKSFVTSKARKRAMQIVKQLQKFADGVYPLGVKRVPSTNPRDYEVNIDEQILDLQNYHKELFGEKRKSKEEIKMEKRNQKRMLKLKKEAEAQKAALKKRAAVKVTEEVTEDGSEKTAPEENGVTDAGSEEAPKAESKKSRKKRAKLRKISPALARKQTKIQLLQRKKEEKMNLLKERLKKKKESAKAAEREPIPEGGHTEEVVVTKSTPVPAKEIPPKEKATPKEKTSPKKKATPKEKTTPKATPISNGKPFQTMDEWSEPLREGEEEYFIPSRKLKSLTKVERTPKGAQEPVAKPTLKRASVADVENVVTPSRKRVKIALCNNKAQDLVEHIKQVKSSPKLPFDSSKKPSKSLLKPNLIPSPINPFYKKKIGLK